MTPPTDEARAGEPRPSTEAVLREALERLMAVAVTEEEDVSAATQDEWIAAMQQANAALSAAPAPTLDVKTALRVMDKLIEIHDCRDPDIGVPCSFHAREHRMLADVVYEESRLSESGGKP